VSDESWTLLTNHGRLLLLIAQDPQALLRELADRAGITERSAQAIVADLERAGYIKKRREGRRNIYTVLRGRPFRHPAEAGHSVGELVDLFADEPAGRKARR
jgi:predicted transcriptional regulator